MTVMAICMGSAVAAHKPTCACETSTQYYLDNGAYIPAGVYGEDYDCLSSTGTCTFYLFDPVGHPGQFAPCRLGTHTFLSKR